MSIICFLFYAHVGFFAGNVNCSKDQKSENCQKTTRKIALSPCIPTTMILNLAVVEHAVQLRKQEKLQQSFGNNAYQLLVISQSSQNLSKVQIISPNMFFLVKFPKQKSLKRNCSCERPFKCLSTFKVAKYHKLRRTQFFSCLTLSSNKCE